MNFITWIISGIIAGWLTGLIIRGRGFGIKGDLIVGLLGGLVAGALLSFIGHTKEERRGLQAIFIRRKNDPLFPPFLRGILCFILPENPLNYSVKTFLLRNKTEGETYENS